MRSVRFYHKDTGIFHDLTIVCSDDRAVELNTPENHSAIDNPSDGSIYDHLSQKIDVSTGQVIDYIPTPPSDEHEWDGILRRWQLNATAVDREAKRSSADTRISVLAEEERHLIRRLILDPQDAVSRKRLEEIDAEIVGIRTI